MELTQEELQGALLNSLGRGFHDHRLCFLHERVAASLVPGKSKPESHNIMQAVWALVARRLIYIDYRQPHPENWSIHLTERGQEAIEDSAINPDNIPQYLSRIAADIPDLTDIPKLYLTESLRAYSNDCFLAATMMLGVTAEAIFYDVASSFAKWLETTAGKTLAEILAKQSAGYTQKFIEFQKRLTANKGLLPQSLQQNLDLNINSILELLRLARNDVGHPTGIQIDRQNAFQYLVVFPGLAKRMYDLKKFCDVSRSEHLV